MRFYLWKEMSAWMQLRHDGEALVPAMLRTNLHVC